MSVMKKMTYILQDKDNLNLAINVIGAFIIKGLSLIVSVFSMPLYIKYFDNQTVLGVWYTVLSILSWISICDLGLGNGLRNKFTMAYALGEKDKAREYVSSTYASLLIIVFPILIIISILVKSVDLNQFLGVSKDVLNSDSLKIAVWILLCGVLISFVLKTINYIIYAIQKSSLNNLISLVSSILPLLYIFIAKGQSLSENLLHLSVVHVISINFPLIIITIVLFSTKKLKEYRPSLKFVRINTSKKMLTSGIQFFGAQIFFMALMSTNEIFITKLFGAKYVVEYSIYYKVFTLVGSLFMIALTPIWSKVTKDLAEKKYNRIKATNRLLYLIAIVAILVEYLIVPYLQILIDIWLQEKSIQVNIITAIIFATFGGLYILNIVLTTVANGFGELRTQIYIYGMGAALKLPILFWGGKVFGHWNFVIIYNCLVLLIFCVIQIIWLEKRINTLIKKEM